MDAAEFKSHLPPADVAEYGALIDDLESDYELDFDLYETGDILIVCEDLRRKRLGRPVVAIAVYLNHDGSLNTLPLYYQNAVTLAGTDDHPIIGEFKTVIVSGQNLETKDAT